MQEVLHFLSDGIVRYRRVQEVLRLGAIKYRDCSVQVLSDIDVGMVYYRDHSFFHLWTLLLTAGSKG